MGSAAGTQAAKAPSPVLCVDLDGTLIRGNLLWECVVALLKNRPASLLLLPIWLLRGRAFLSGSSRNASNSIPSRLPYRQQVLDLLRDERVTGRRIALVTASDLSLARSISGYLGLFDEVHASDGDQNLKGEAKAAFLSRHFSQTGFDYVGDSAADLKVWRHAHAAYVVGTPARAEQAAALTTVNARHRRAGSIVARLDQCPSRASLGKESASLSASLAFAQPLTAAAFAHRGRVCAVRLLRFRPLHPQ